MEYKETKQNKTLKDDKSLAFELKFKLPNSWGGEGEKRWLEVDIRIVMEGLGHFGDDLVQQNYKSYHYCNHVM